MNTYEVRITKTICHYYEIREATEEAAIAHAHRLAYESGGSISVEVWCNKWPQDT